MCKNIYELQYDSLSNTQRHCVCHDNGRALVLAGPGSGKTKVITLRASRLILSGYRVLTMSFNKAAAEEIKRRTYNILLETDCIIDDSMFSTIHSFCLTIIKLFGKSKKILIPRVLNETEQSEKIASLYAQLYKKKINIDELRRLLSYIRCKNDEKTNSNSDSIMLDGELFERIFCMYKKYKKDNNFIDYDDMLNCALEILKTDNIFLQMIKHKFDYIQVDEGQDLSDNQYKIITLLNNNLFIVADDDQSIYGFRGAAPSILNDFKKNNCNIYYLEENYRCNLNITSVSSEFIKNNDERFEKNIFTRNFCYGKLKIKIFKNVMAQAHFCNKIIRNLTINNSLCILYRNNISALCPMIVLMIQIFYKKNNLLDFSISSVILTHDQFEALSNIIKLDVFENHKVEKILFDYSIYGKKRFFVNCIKSAAKFAIENVLNKDKENFILFLKDKVFCCKNTKVNIYFSTIHSAKGLEFDNVIIIDNVEGELPGNDLLTIEEERRLLYVAMTRAKTNLYICASEKCFDQQLTVSRFIYETKQAIKSYY